MGAKVDPIVPSSLDTQFDEIMKTLVNNAVSLEMKQCVMQRAHVKLSQGYLECPGKRCSFSP